VVASLCRGYLFSGIIFITVVQCYLCIAATHFSPGIGKKKMDDNTMQTAGLRPWQSSVQRRPSMQCVGHYCTGMKKKHGNRF